MAVSSPSIVGVSPASNYIRPLVGVCLVAGVSSVRGVGGFSAGVANVLAGDDCIDGVICFFGVDVLDVSGVVRLGVEGGDSFSVLLLVLEVVFSSF